MTDKTEGGPRIKFEVRVEAITYTINPNDIARAMLEDTHQWLRDNAVITELGQGTDTIRIFADVGIERINAYMANQLEDDLPEGLKAHICDMEKEYEFVPNQDIVRVTARFPD